jgi:hypothetical protein
VLAHAALCGKVRSEPVDSNRYAVDAGMQERQEFAKNMAVASPLLFLFGIFLAKNRICRKRVK